MLIAQVSTSTLAATALAAFFVFLVAKLIPRPGFETDLNTFAAWSERLLKVGLGNFYKDDAFADYFPGYLYLLRALAPLLAVLPAKSWGWYAVLKGPSFLALTAVAAGIGLRRAGRLGAPVDQGVLPPLPALFLWLFNPALLFNAGVFGQTDVVYVLLGWSALLALASNRFALAGLLCGIAVAFKPFGLTLLPVVLARLASERARPLAWGAALGTCGATVVALVYGFWHGRMAEALPYYAKQLATYPFVSVDGFNLYAGLGFNWVRLDQAAAFGFSWMQVSFMVMVVGCLAATAPFLWRFYQRRGHLTLTESMLAGAALTLTFFMTAPAMHERYVLLTFPFFAMIFARSRRLLAAFLGLSFIAWCDQSAAIQSVIVTKTFIRGVSPYAFASMLGKLSVLVALFAELQAGAPSRPGAPRQARSLRKMLGRRALATPHDQGSLPHGQTVCRVRGVDLGIAAALGALSLAAGFHRLGSSHVYQTEASPLGTLEVRFPPDTDVADAALLLTGGAAEARLICDVPSPGEPPVRMTSFYTWHRLPVPRCGDHRWFLQVVGERFRLGAMRFSDHSGSLVEPTEVCDDGPGNCGPARLHPLFAAPDPGVVPGNYYYESVFDEIYYARSAREILDGEPPYETTHPPLGKVLDALCVDALGFSPFGWRFLSALCGALIPLAVFIGGRALLNDRRSALFAASLSLCDGLRASMARVFTIDIIATFFILLSYLFFFVWLRRRMGRRANGDQDAGAGPPTDTALLAATSVTLGLGVAVKWISVFALVAQLALLVAAELQAALATRRARPVPLAKAIHLRPWTAVWAFLLAPAAIYVASYLPLLMNGSMAGGLVQVLQNQVDMYSYHSSITGEHPYMSGFYDWLVLNKTLLISQGQDAGHARSVITALGTPAVAWSALVVIVATLIKTHWRRWVERPECLLVLAFAAQLLPWAFVTRSTFIYHYLPAQTLAIILLGDALGRLYRRRPVVVALFVALCIANFAWFYPVLTGQGVSSAYVASVRWFDSWQF